MAKCISGGDKISERRLRGNSNESMMERLVCSLGWVLGLEAQGNLYLRKLVCGCVQYQWSE